MKKLFSLFMTLCMAIAVSAAPVTYDLWFDGVQVTSSNANKIHDSWYIKYDANTKTLTLDNIGFTSKTAEVIKSDIEGLTIKVIGTVNLSSTAADRRTFAFNGKTTIVGSGVGSSMALLKISLALLTWNSGSYCPTDRQHEQKSHSRGRSSSH